MQFHPSLSGCALVALMGLWWPFKAVAVEMPAPRLPAVVSSVTGDRIDGLRDRLLWLGGEVASWPEDKQILFLRMAQAELVQRSRWWLLVEPNRAVSNDESLMYEWVAAEYFQHGLLAEALHHRRMAACSFAESRNLLRLMRGGIYTVSSCALADMPGEKELLQGAGVSVADRDRLIAMLAQWSSLSGVLAVLETRARSSPP